MVEDQSIKKYTLLAVTLASFLTAITGSAINLAIPAIGNEFQSSTTSLSWVATSYLLACAAFLVPFGRLGDIVGRRKIFLLGVNVFFLSSLMCGFAWSMASLILFRIIQGIGAGMIFSTNMAILTSVFSPQERGRVFGISVAAVYTGLSFGPAIGGFLNHQFGWQSIFIFTSILALIVVLFTAFGLKGEWHGAAGEKFDRVGSFLYVLGITAFMYGISAMTTSPAAKFVFLAGFIILLVFGFYEVRIQHPILYLSLFKNITFAFSNLAAFISYSATFALGFLLSLYLQEIQGYDSQVSGLILLSQPVIMALLSPFSGSLSDRIEPRVLATLGMVITTVGLIPLSFLTPSTPVWLLILDLIFLGIGFALFSSPNTHAVMSSVEIRYSGIASSTLATMRMTGQAVSMAIVTLIMSVYLGDAQLSPSLYGSLLTSTKTSFAVFALICFVGIFASWARGKKQPVQAGNQPL
ncbi:MFS transporter [Dehalobacterium formicoaceticum]|uniref:MFS transporter n=1 Tax=Dehalobacterium formicoaceticum TaxID=51515 RepID=A0ABT1Y0F0_9FIRM|nr:MFS transporter [Dehalobacterium formicoaceticum]MCR6543991.1 MFS transporter [Dehalobacterium formicoaceticum]